MLAEAENQDAIVAIAVEAPVPIARPAIERLADLYLTAQAIFFISLGIAATIVWIIFLGMLLYQAFSWFVPS